MPFQFRKFRKEVELQLVRFCDYCVVHGGTFAIIWIVFS